MQPDQEFATRHIGPRPDEIASMLGELGYDDLDAFIADIVPASIALDRPLALEP
ncbi:MAG: hypothetical protein KC544_15975, partial [Gemmatimonadetes bacterium]|nr:hypothetical protein [Gemmatimonadota bacterium]